MTKADLIKRLANLPDDAQVTFALFTYLPQRGYCWQLLAQTIDHGDPSDVIGLSTQPFRYDNLADFSLIK